MPMMLYTRADGRVEMTPIRINGVTIPCPSEWQPQFSDLHKNSERNASGYLTADRVRANVRKFDLKWNYMLPADFAAFKTLISASLFFTVEYIDEAGGISTATMYKGDISSTVHRILATGAIQGYMNVGVPLIER
jgi:hypothetical protein